MLILLSNDDGVESPGLAALAEHLRDLGTVQVVAPAQEQSARSHAFTMHEPLRVDRRAPGWFAVSGTPADCVYVALHHLCAQRPAVLVSGINRGTNLGDDLHYSGTVAAAREATLAGIPALAVSMDARPGRLDRDRHWDTAAALARHVVRLMLDNPLPPRVFLNLNCPDEPGDRLSGLHVTRVGRREYAPRVSEQKDPRGRPYYWIGGEHRGFCDEPGSDGHSFSRGHPTLSPVAVDVNPPGMVDTVAAWTLRDSPR